MATRAACRSPGNVITTAYANGIFCTDSEANLTIVGNVVSGVDLVSFSHGTPTTVATFLNVLPNKLYSFLFQNGNTTIDRTNAYLDGGTNKIGQAASLAANS